MRSFTSTFGPSDGVQLLILARPFLGSGSDFKGAFWLRLCVGA